MPLAIYYVDNLNGNDLNSGNILEPLQSLGEAYDRSSSGGLIILQEGDGSSYGDLTVSKNISILAAYGSYPVIGKLTINTSQGLFRGLTFDTSLIEGVVVSSVGLGSISLKECYFDGIDNPINIKDVNYISIAQCDFIGFVEGIKIETAKGVNISGNVFARGSRSIDVNTIGHLEVYHNTIVDSGTVSSTVPPDSSLRVIYHTLTPFDIQNKRISLPSLASQNSYGYDVGLSVTTGPSFYYGDDYTVIGNGYIVSWEGLILENQLEVGEVLRVMYSEGAPAISGEAIRAQNIIDTNSSIDSNNFSGLGAPFPDIALGVYLNTPVKIRYNNFYGVTTNYDGSVASDDTGNISADTLFKDIPGNDFKLRSGSPSIDSADPERWAQAWLGITGGTVYNAVPFNRNKDKLGARRNYVTPDIGAFEYVTGVSGDLINYIDERGFDFIGTGGETGPFATLDRAFLEAKDLNVNLNPAAGYTGMVGIPEIGRYRSRNILFKGYSRVDVGVSGLDNTALIHSSYPSLSANKVYVSPDGGDTGYFMIGSETGTYNGSYTGPFRTINGAIAASSAENIIVFPGIYPEFTGASGMHLIGVSKTVEVDRGGKIVSKFLREEWSTSGEVNFNFNSLKVFDGGSVMYDEYFEFPLRMHLKVDSVNDFKIELSNGTHGFSINKKSGVSISHKVDGISYTIPAPEISGEVLVDLGVTGIMGVTGAVMDYKVRGNGSVYEKSITLWEPSYTGIQFSVGGVSGGPVSVSSFKMVNDYTGEDNIERIHKSTFGIRDGV